ncbi:MAG TPA: hypothetical protein VF229_02605 [Burkholderiaceae bacterium]
MSDRTSSASQAEGTLADAIAVERARIARRRERLGVPEGGQAVPGHWALALSGGGIRSATFSLGVMQGLAHLASPASSGTPAAGAIPGEAGAESMLSSFDYLSTVSGGGYIGAFYCSLFVPGRLRKATTPEQAAADAMRVLAYEPPTRIRSATEYVGDALYSAPTAWLRESGRYLTPTGAGDMLYAAAVAIRNWFAVQYVLATLLLAAFALLALGRSALALWIPWIQDFEAALLDAPKTAGGLIWWSPLWLLPAAVGVLWLVPAGIAFWLLYPDPNQSESDPARPLSRGAWGGLAAGAMILLPAAGMYFADTAAWHRVAYAAAAAGAVTLLAVLLYEAGVRQFKSIVEFRVRLTRWLASGLSFGIVLVVLAASDTIGQSLYFDLTQHGGVGSILTPSALLAAAVWLIRHLAQLFEDKEKPAWIAKISLNLLAGVFGALLFVLVATLWALLVQWIRWHGGVPGSGGFSHASHVRVLAWARAIFTGLALISARFPAFINLSTLQSFYGSRLTRAYLGASNGRRFEPGTEGRVSRSVAEPLTSDQLEHGEYYAEDVLAPVHLINVTVNQTVDPAEQLVQRDRKGEPLCILPSGFSIDGQHHVFREQDDRGTIQDRLTIGQWIGTSGAAFTTGLGRSTSLGFSLLLGLANVRLGTWWPSGYGRDRAPRPERAFKRLFRTQTFLLYELMGRFYGLHREWQYLSDGGHFENTAIYELLRPERGLGLIVACDDGCDPAYQFGDMANLIRLARIDFRIEIEVDTGIAADPELGRIFGVPEDFARDDPSSDRCAMLFNVYRPTDSGRTPEPACRIVVLKPRRLRSIPLDVREYADRHRDFPQETTADQFFDEAQWESYRRLGFGIANLVFGEGRPGSDGVGVPLWRYLKGGHPG